MSRWHQSTTITLGRALSLIYFMTWIYLVAKHIGDLSLSQATDVFMNALIIALFVGLGLNVNAFQVQAGAGSNHSLNSRICYIRDHIGNVLAFFVIPFCVSSVSSLVVAVDGASLVQALFGTSSYVLIMVGGFAVFILLPALYILYRHGWK